MAKRPNLLGNLNISQIDNTNKEELNQIESEAVLEHINFDFQADEDTLNYLKNQTYKLHLTMSKSYTELGKIFKDTQERLTGNNQYDGLFYKWFKSLNFTNDFVYKLINRYNLLIRFSDKQNLIEALPITLSYEISKPNCLEKLRDKVLEGEIKTLKEFIEAKNQEEKINNEPIKEIELANIEENLDKDFALLNQNFSTLNKTFQEKVNNLNSKKKEKIMKEIDVINQKLEKLINSI